MNMVVWLALLCIVAGFGYAFWLVLRKHAERKQAAEERLTAFMAQMHPAAPKPEAAVAPAPEAAPAPKAEAAPAPVSTLGMQKMLFEAAFKAGEAGEPALSIQLYARLIARYPDGTFVAQARAAADREKAKLARS